MSMVPSVEALSTTMTSFSRYFCWSTDSRQRLMKRPLLYVTTVTETKSFCAMNKNLRGRAFCTSTFTLRLFGAGRYCSVPPAEHQATAGMPHDFPICCQGFEAPLEDCFPQTPQ